VVDGYSHAEIAETMEITEGTSKSQLFEAKKRLKNAISQNREYVRV
jgi:RNA polymerase sigma-70 factor (ECF subfamily)